MKFAVIKHPKKNQPLVRGLGGNLQTQIIVFEDEEAMKIWAIHNASDDYYTAEFISYAVLPLKIEVSF